MFCRSLLSGKLPHVKMGSNVSLSTFEPTFCTGMLAGIAVSYIFFKRRKDSWTDELLEKYNEENFQFPNPDDECRLVICIRNDLKMQKGKVAAQCGHASVAAYVKALKFAPTTLKQWMSFGGTKITLKVDSEEELLSLEKSAQDIGLLTSVVRDAGQTQVAPGSRTVIAIGPAPQTQLAKVTGHLKLY